MPATARPAASEDLDALLRLYIQLSPENAATFYEAHGFKASSLGFRRYFE